MNGDLFDQMGPQHDAPADVVSDQAGRVKAPAVDEFGQGVGLLGDRRGDSWGSSGVAEAEQVPDVDAVSASQDRYDLAPQVRPRRSAVDEDDRWTLSEGSGGYFSRHGTGRGARTRGDR